MQTIRKGSPLRRIRSSVMAAVFIAAYVVVSACTPMVSGKAYAYSGGNGQTQGGKNEPDNPQGSQYKNSQGSNGTDIDRNNGNSNDSSGDQNRYQSGGSQGGKDNDGYKDTQGQSEDSNRTKGGTESGSQGNGQWDQDKQGDDQEKDRQQNPDGDRQKDGNNTRGYDDPYQGGDNTDGHSKDESRDKDKEKNDKKPHKMFICRYVGTSYEDEMLDGADWTEFSDGQDRTPGSYFEGTQGRYYVLGYDEGNGHIKGHTPSVKNCPSGHHHNPYDPGGGGTQPVIVTPVAPTVTIVCGADNDTVTLPTVQGITYSFSGWLNGHATVTAVANAGYALASGTVASWSFDDAATSCGNVLGESMPTVKAATTVAVLADTGTSSFLPTILGSGLLGAAVLTTLQNSKSRGKFAAYWQKTRRLFAVPFVVPLA